MKVQTISIAYQRERGHGLVIYDEPLWRVWLRDAVVVRLLRYGRTYRVANRCMAKLETPAAVELPITAAVARQVHDALGWEGLMPGEDAGAAGAAGGASYQEAR